MSLRIFADHCISNLIIQLLQDAGHEVLPQLIARLKDYLTAQPNMDDYKGKLILVEIHRIRVRS